MDIFSFLNTEIERKLTEIHGREDVLNQQINVLEAEKSKVQELDGNIDLLPRLTKEQIISYINNINSDDELITEADIHNLIINGLSQDSSDRIKNLYTLLQLMDLGKFFDLTSIINDEQREFMSSFINKVITSINEKINEINIERDNLVNSNTELHDLESFKEMLENSNNSNFIIDLSIMNKLFQLNELEESEKRELLLQIYEKNLSIFDQRNSELVEISQNTVEESVEELSEVVEEEISLEKITKEELIELFNSYNLLIDKFSDDLLDFIANIGYKEVIKKNLALLKDNRILEYIKLDKKDDIRKAFANILVRTKSDLLEKNIRLFKEKMIGTSLSEEFEKNASKYLSLFIGNGIKHRKSGRQVQTEESELYNEYKKYIINGYAEDLEKNIEIFESKGINIEKLCEKTVSILNNPHEMLKYNFEVLKLYGINFKPEKDAYSVLDGSKLPETADKFIEVTTSGESYIKNSKSNLKRINDTSSYFYDLHQVHKEKRPIDLRSETEKLIKYNSTLETRHAEFISNNKEMYDRIVESKLDNRRKAFVNGEINEQEGNVLFDYDILEDSAVAKILGRASGLSIIIGEEPRRKYDIAALYVSKIKFLKVYSALKEYVNNENKKEILAYSLSYNSFFDDDDLIRIGQFVNKVVSRERGL